MRTAAPTVYLRLEILGLLVLIGCGLFAMAGMIWLGAERGDPATVTATVRESLEPLDEFQLRTATLAWACQAWADQPEVEEPYRAAGAPMETLADEYLRCSEFLSSWAGKGQNAARSRETPPISIDLREFTLWGGGQQER